MTAQTQFDAWVGGSDGTSAPGAWSGVNLLTPGTSSLEYLVIRDAETGLSLNDVDASSSISYVQTHNTDGDGFALTGGAVPMDHLVASEHVGSGLTWRLGWTGSAQFVVTTGADGSGIRGTSNPAAPNDPPVSQAALANMTIVGNGAEDLGGFLDGGTGALVYNSIVTGSETCLDVDGAATYDQLRRGNLRFENVILDCLLAPFADDLDNQGETLTYDVVANSNPGLVGTAVVDGVLNLDFGTSGSGDATITVRATDTSGAVTTPSFTVNVAGVNEAPMLVNELEDAIVFEGTADFMIDLTTVIEDADAETTGDTLTYSVDVADPTLVAGTVTDGVLSLAFVDGQIGDTTVTITATDSDGETVSTTFAVSVLPVNAAGIPGVNVKVSGPTPDTNPLFKADTTLRQQNEVRCAMRPDNELHMFCGFNDYRGADDPEVGDSWQGVAMTRDGGLTWKSRLTPGWKGYPQSIGQGFTADPAIAPVPGAMIYAFIASDRDEKGPGGLYIQRWWERGAESGLPWTPEKETIQAVAGDIGRFIDKDDLLFTLDEPGARFNEDTGSYYLEVASGGATWEEAQAAATALGGDLVTVNDADEQAWLRRTFPGRHWIGLNDVATEGAFAWANGEAVTFTVWLPGEPGAETEGHDYAVINSGPFGEWATEANAGFAFSGIAELSFDPDPDATPSTLTLQVELEDAPEGTLEPGTVPAGTLTAAYAEFVDTPPSVEGLESFEAPVYLAGQLGDGEGGATPFAATGPGATIIEGTASEGDQVLMLRAQDPTTPTVVTRAGAEPFAFETNARSIVSVGFDFSLNPVDTTPGTFSVALPFADVVISNGTVSIQTSDPEDTYSVSPVVYNRLTFQADYDRQVVNVFVDGVIFAANLRFKNADLGPLTDFAGIEFTALAGSSLDELRIDNVNIALNETNGANMMITQSRDLGRTWTTPTQISNPADVVNQGVAITAAGERVLAVWRRFIPPGVVGNDQTNALMYAIKEPSVDEWTEAEVLHEVCPFDLRANDAQFRSNAFPTFTSDGMDFYVFWADRDFADVQVNDNCTNGFARVVMSRLQPGGAWSDPVALEAGPDIEVTSSCPMPTRQQDRSRWLGMTPAMMRPVFLIR